MKETIKSIIDWSEQTFPDATLDGQLDKYYEEQQEYLESKCKDITELADMFIVACGIARFNLIEGMYHIADVVDWFKEEDWHWTTFEKAINEKMKINKKREWEKKEGLYKHKGGKDA